MEGITLRESVMHISFNAKQFVSALPGGIIFGHVAYKFYTFEFLPNKYVVIAERHLSELTKVLQALSKNIILEGEDQSSEETVQCGETILSVKDKTIQCRFDDSSFDIKFDLSSLLAFLIGIRKVAFWIIGPTNTQFDLMDFFVRQILRNNTNFPKSTQIEEDIKTIMETYDFDLEKKFQLTQFLLNHHTLLEFQYNLFSLTTKQKLKTGEQD